MAEPIEEAYFNWLYAKVLDLPGTIPSTKYHSLLFYLHSTEFTWIVIGDDNRASEGKYLRYLFINEIWKEPAEPWMDLGCSVLEMLIAFAERAAFQTEISRQNWFWLMLENLSLADVDEASYGEYSERIGPILETFMWRTYDERGHGGLFPMSYTTHDQREIEIWYQFCEYVVEQNII